RDNAFLQHLRPVAPGHDAVRGRGEKLRARNQRWPASGIKPPEYVGPGAVASDRRACSSRAIGEAANWSHDDGQAFGCAGGGRGELYSGWFFRILLDRAGASAGDADVNFCLIRRSHASPLRLKRAGCDEGTTVAEAPRPALIGSAAGLLARGF